MQQSSAHWVIHAKTCPRPSWDPADVQQSSAYQTSAIFLLPTTLRDKRCVLKQSKKTQRIWTLSLITLRPKKCVTRQWEKTLTICNMSNCFVTSEQAKIWHENFDSDDDNEFIMWYNGYKKCKVWGKGYRKMIKEKVRS